jgi:invasion protein IalB
MERAMRAAALSACLIFLISPAFGQQPPDRQIIMVGPWSIATTYKADKFDSCTMSRSQSDVGIAFVRNQDGLLLTLDSTKWKLERGAAYAVRLTAGSRSVDAKALAETKSVTIAFADRSFNSNLRTANMLQVRGEGATIQVPLDGSSMALDRLESCFERNSREARESNPFVAPSRRP